MRKGFAWPVLVILLITLVPAPAWGGSISGISGGNLEVWYSGTSSAISGAAGIGLDTATVAEIAAATGATEAEVIALGSSVNSALKGGGMVGSAAVSVPQIAAAVAVGYLVDQGAAALSEGVFGKIRYFSANGTEISAGDPFTDHEYYVIEGGLWPSGWPPELAFMLPGFVFEVPTTGYTFNSTPTQPDWVGGVANPGNWVTAPWVNPPNSTWNTYAWPQPDGGWMATYLVASAFGNMPIEPNAGDYSTRNWLTCNNGSIGMNTWRNRFTGAQTTAPYTYMGVSTYFGGGLRTYYISSLATSVDYSSIRSWIESQTAQLVAAGTISEAVETYVAPATADPAPMTDPKMIPTIGSYNGTNTDEDTLATAIGNVTVPSSLPTGVEETTGESPVVETRTNVVGVALGGLTNALNSRAPFAYVAAITDPPVATGSDGMVWTLRMHGGIDSMGISGEVQQQIAPLEWLDPFVPWRWVFVSGIWITGIIALWVLLRPQIHI